MTLIASSIRPSPYPGTGMGDGAEQAMRVRACLDPFGQVHVLFTPANPLRSSIAKPVDRSGLRRSSCSCQCLSGVQGPNFNAPWKLVPDGVLRHAVRRISRGLPNGCLTDWLSVETWSAAARDRQRPRVDLSAVEDLPWERSSSTQLHVGFTDSTPCTTHRRKPGACREAGAARFSEPGRKTTSL